jgi:DNA invertase Pin-like site-specific DNA recombinase
LTGRLSGVILHSVKSIIHQTELIVMSAKSISKLVAYYRVSTVAQGESGLGLEAQKAAVEAYAAEAGLQIVAEFVEVESGKDNDRPELLKAMLKTKRTKGAGLIVKSQCRLARRTSKALTIFEQLPVVVADRPHMTILEIQLRAVIDEEEARRISERTKAALKAAKARGVKLGTPENLTADAQKAGAESNRRKATDRTKDILPTVLKLRAEGKGMKAIADALNAAGETTPNGGDWHAAQIQRILKRQA